MKLSSSFAYRLILPGFVALAIAARAADGPPPAVPILPPTTTVPAKPTTNSFVLAGDKVLPFEAKTMDGKTVKFPQDYKGKVVLLDFWASWCPDCRNVLPDVVANYEKYHAQGLEILGISLDKADMAEKLTAFMQTHKMPWPEVYDGNYRKAAIAVQYNVLTIPHVFLVDGTTGMIIDDRDNVSAATIEKALAARKPGN